MVVEGGWEITEALGGWKSVGPPLISGGQADRWVRQPGLCLGRGQSWGSLSITVPLEALRADDLPQAQLWVLVPGTKDADPYLSFSSHPCHLLQEALPDYLGTGLDSFLCAPAAAFTLNRYLLLVTYLS